LTDRMESRVRFIALAAQGDQTISGTIQGARYVRFTRRFASAASLNVSVAASNTNLLLPTQ
jgi:hypothetical protein